MTNMIKYNDKTKSVICNVDSRIYSLDVIHKCCYWYNEHFITEVSILESNKIKIEVTGKTKAIDESTFTELSKKIKQDLIDFKTRDIVTKETKNVRDLLIAKAFSNLDEE